MAPPEQLYDSIHHLQSSVAPTRDDLVKIVQTFPIIDNHAHNILREEEADNNHDYPFESITSEAQGHALQEHVHSTLAHIRAVNQLSELFSCEPTLQDVKAARYDRIASDFHGLLRECFQGTHALLIDDGLPQDSVYPVAWHNQLVPTAKRIVRIEAIAAELLEQLVETTGLIGTDWSIGKSEAVLSRFNTVFRKEIRNLASDPVVRGFKSVVCYRSGLDVSLDSRDAFRPHQSLTDSALLASFHSFLKMAVKTRKFRIQQKEVNDFLVVSACDVLDKLIGVEGETLPIQFHTGLGDNDISLVKANPAYMQPLIAAFPNVDFVILHSSYPYTREAGYLAANYANAWLDIGEVFPMLSRTGQESVLRQALELTPASKILWSTDGHFYPETFYLANKQMRNALRKVLLELVDAGDATIAQAISMAVDIMFWNSNALYKLDEERKYPELLRACGRDGAASVKTTLVNSKISSQTLQANDVTESSPPNHTQEPKPETDFIGTARNESQPLQSLRGQLSGVSSSNEDATDKNHSANISQTKIWMDFLQLHPGLHYVWLQFISNTGTVRARMVPVKQLRKQLEKHKYIGITMATPRLLQNEMPAEGCIATGEFQLVPDLSSLCLNKGIDSASATVQTWWMAPSELSEDNPGLRHYEVCPRWTLQRQVDALSQEFHLNMLVGFEVEVVFMRPIYNENRSDFESFELHQSLHSWSSMTYSQLDDLPMIEEIQRTLAEVGIEIEQFHAEAAPGQWEFPLPAYSPVKAVDTLYKARDIIGAIAKKNGLKATVYPRPFLNAPGSACHAHFSINGDKKTVAEHEDSFLAGVLAHLPSIMAFSLPIDKSYDRVQPGIWAGGEWITWGTQNREAPVRKCGTGHWELKTSDGMGNMYFAMAALVASGLHGLREKLELTIEDTKVDASSLSDEERKQLGITTKLPNSLAKSTRALDQDVVLRELLGDIVVDDYLAVKTAEKKQFDAMTEKDRRTWLIARY